MTYFDVPREHRDGTKDITCGTYPNVPLINAGLNSMALQQQLKDPRELEYFSNKTQGLAGGLPFFKRTTGVPGPWFPYNNFEIVDMRSLRSRRHWDIWLYVDKSVAFFCAKQDCGVTIEQGDSAAKLVMKSHGIGDAPFRGYVLPLVVSPNAIISFADVVKYRHPVAKEDCKRKRKWGGEIVISGSANTVSKQRAAKTVHKKSKRQGSHGSNGQDILQ